MPYRPAAIFADTPVLSVIPDIPYYYANVRGVSFIVDLVLLGMVFAELMKITAAKAKIKGRFGVILGIIMGASLTFAIHGAGYTLLQHPLLGLIIGLAAGTVAYRMTKDFWGKGGAIAFGLLIGMIVQGVAAAGLWGDRMSGIFSLFVMLAFIAGMLALIFMRMRRGLGLGPGLGPSPGPGPDLESKIINAINQLRTDIENRFATQGAVLTRIEGAITAINNILQDILRRLDQLEGFFNSWRNWFSELVNRLDIIKNEVLRANGLLDQHITFMTDWKGQWDKFKDNAIAALDKLKADMGEALKRLGDVSSGMTAVQESQTRIEEAINRHDSVLADLGRRIEALPATVAAEVKQGLQQEFQAVIAELNTIKNTLRGFNTLKQNVAHILEIVRRWETPGIKDSLDKIEANKQEILRKLDELSRKADDCIKSKGRAPEQIIISLGQFQNAGRDITSGISNATNTIGGIKDLAPRLAELLESFGKLKTDNEGLKNAVGALEKLIKDLTDKLAAEEAKAPPPTPPTEIAQVIDLEAVERSVNAQYAVLQDLMKKVQALMGKLKFAAFDTKTDESTWKAIAQEAINEAKKDVGEIKLEERQITEVQEALHKARADIQRQREFIATMLPEDQARLNELDSRLAKFEQFETDLLGFFRNIDQALVQQVVVAINERIEERRKAGAKVKDIKSVSGSTVLAKLDEYVKKLADAIQVTLEISREVKVEKEKAKKAAAETKKRAEQKKRARR